MFSLNTDLELDKGTQEGQGDLLTQTEPMLPHYRLHFGDP